MCTPVSQCFHVYAVIVVACVDDMPSVRQSDSPDAQVAAVRNLHTIFVRLLQSNEMFMDKPGARSLPGTHDYVITAR